jgi:hypothetical protein
MKYKTAKDELESTQKSVNYKIEIVTGPKFVTIHAKARKKQYEIELPKPRLIQQL